MGSLKKIPPLQLEPQKTSNDIPLPRNPKEKKTLILPSSVTQKNLNDNKTCPLTARNGVDRARPLQTHSGVPSVLAGLRLDPLNLIQVILAKGESTMCFRIILLLTSCSLITGFFWVIFAKIYKKNLPFRWTGLLSGVWFIPAFLAAEVLSSPKISGCQWFGGIFICECLAALVSALLGPFSWLSFHFGLAQGLVGEAVYFLIPQPLEVAIGVLVTDWVLSGLHPQLKLFRVHALKEWTFHLLGGAVSTFLVLEGTQQISQILLGSLLHAN